MNKVKKDKYEIILTGYEKSAAISSSANGVTPLPLTADG
jgi:hypothetical protein